MTALIKGLEEVNGDVSDQSKLQEALAGMTLSGDEAPWGDVKLDDNRQAISDVYVKKIVKDANGDGMPDVQTFRQGPEGRPDLQRVLHGGHARLLTARTRSARRARPRRGSATSEEVDFSSE